MSNLTALAQWDDVYQLETTDPVMGGVLGMSNRQPQQLLNRTEFLRSLFGVWAHVKDIDGRNGSGAVTVDSIGKIIQVVATANTTLTIAALGSFTVNDVLIFVFSGSAPVTLKCTGSDHFIYGYQFNPAQLYFHDGEFVKVAVTAIGFMVIDISPGVFDVGNTIDGYVQQHNTLVRDGALYNRDAYPRLWDWINRKLGVGGPLVDESTWNISQTVIRNGVNVTVFPYRGCFGSGNGSTNFRVPDDRAMFTRYLDLGRGIDTARLHNYAGGLELDQILAHGHRNIYELNGTDGTANGETLFNGDTEGHGNGYNSNSIEATGGTENLVKNTAKIPLIKY